MARVSATEFASVNSSDDVTIEEKLALVERIIATPPFEKSERLVSFLLYVSRLEADGRVSEISEQHIGHAVFGRSKTYDPSVDGIVRSHASRLRLRLDQYFDTDGQEERVRVSMPRGAYVPVYELKPAESASDHLISAALDTTLITQPQINSDVRAKEKRGWWTTGVLVAAAFVAGIALSSPPLSRLRTFLHQPTPSEIFWSNVFPSGKVATLVVGDAGVNMFENIARRQVSTEEYSSRSWLNEPLAQTPPGYTWVPMAQRSYTPWFVVGVASRLARACEARGIQFKTISARELTLDALKNDQLVLIGGPEYNPWEQLLEKDQNFIVSYDGAENSISILNRHPEPGEPAVYKWQQTNPASHSGYSLISFGKNLKENGHVLLLAGTTAQGDEAAAEFLLDSSRLDPFLKKAALRMGTLVDFEVVLKIDFMAGGNVDSHIVAFRAHP